MSNLFDLTGKVAVITGSSRGIGKAIAEQMAAAGAKVVISSRKPEACEPVAEELRKAGYEAMAIACHVGKKDDLQNLVDKTKQAYGQIDVLVCNAATTTPLCKVEELDVEDWRRALDVNLTSAFLLSKFALPEIRRSGGGNIIIVASQMGSVGWMGQSAYCSTKGALIQLGKVLALDYAKENIRVNTLSPGGVATDRLIDRYGSEPTAQAEWGPMHPVGRLGQADEIARGAVFLASDDSTFITGSDLVMDGGYTAW